MFTAEEIVNAVDWTFVHVFPWLGISVLCIQVLNQVVLWRGRLTKRLADPVYLVWIAYGLSDISTVICLLIDILTDHAITFKWLAWWDWSTAWYPSLFLQLTLAVYYVVLLKFPVWYFKNSEGPKLRRIVYLTIFLAYVLGFIVCFPMALPGYDVCYCPEGYRMTQKMEDIYGYFEIFDRFPIIASFICYFYLTIRVCLEKKKVGSEITEGQTQKHKRVVRMLKIAFISWTITTVHLLFFDLQLLFLDSDMAGAIFYILQLGSFMIHIAANPIVQLVRNSSYRKEAQALMCGMSGTTATSTRVKPVTTEGTTKVQ